MRAEMNDFSTVAPPSHAEDTLSSVWTKVRACMQCGTCTGSCVNAHAMDLTPRELWRMVQLGLKDEIFASKTFWLCSSCYYCTLRCPRGLPLTETMGALKRLATAEGILKEKRSPRFYRSFMETVRRYGRVREMEMMARYFLALKSPITPLAFTPLGIRLMAKGKVAPRMPSFSGRGKLDALYRKVKEVEARS
ncbi:MAG: 4Fe-4S dicluster domain-containing protein [Syntrophobacteraceae bacterium]|nr:4Fe-4S dicluster domain-containing protein [Syntrophobacteraceae bacterium]